MLGTLRLTLVAIGLFAGLAGAPCHAASETAQFHAAVADATAHYREAGFYLHTGNPAVAGFELDTLADKWSALADRFAKAPPDAYADDDTLALDLKTISTHIEAARKAVAVDDIKEAKRALKPIRGILGDLRRRNGFFLLSDCVDEANAAMAALWKFRHAPPDFGDPVAVDKARAATAVTTLWFRRCGEMAPPTIAKNGEFRRLIETSLYSLDRIWIALREKKQRMFINILRELKSSDRLLYVRFG